MGISPDIDIENRPEDVMRGMDEQIERAVAKLMQRLPGPTLAKSDSRRE